MKYRPYYIEGDPIPVPFPVRDFMFDPVETGYSPELKNRGFIEHVPDEDEEGIIHLTKVGEGNSTIQDTNFVLSDYNPFPHKVIDPLIEPYPDILTLIDEEPEKEEESTVNKALKNPYILAAGVFLIGYLLYKIT